MNTVGLTAGAVYLFCVPGSDYASGHVTGGQ